MERRNFLKAVGGTVIPISLAGCYSQSSSRENKPDENELVIPLEGNEFSQLELYNSISTTHTINALFLSGTFNANVLLYEDTAVSEKVSELTYGQFTRNPQRVLGTIYVQGDGTLGGFLSEKLGRVKKNIVQNFESQLAKFGVKNTKIVSESDTKYVVNGEVPIQPFTIKRFNLPNKDGIRFDPPSVKISAGFELKVKSSSEIIGYIWVEPKNYSHTLEKIDLTSNGSDGLSITPRIVLRFQEYESVSEKYVWEFIQQSNPTQFSQLKRNSKQL